jgi:predicted nucleotide-binding protein (sugar kinase/HSP70/actin superfamily)
MKISFPNLGNAYLAAKALFDGLGIDYVEPVPSNKTALEIGSLHSPEEICLPFKIMIGNYIQAIEKGADTVIITGSCGPCRYGEYCELQINMMKRMGYDLDFIVIDAPRDIGKEEFFNRIDKIASKSSKTKLQKYKALKDAYTVITLIDDIEARLRYLNGYEINKGQCKDTLRKCKEEAEKTNVPEEMIKILKRYKSSIKNIPIDKNKKPVKIALMGEIYTILEPFSNLYIEDKLMDYGVSVKKGLSPSWWVKNTVLTTVKMNSLDLRRASKEYLPYYIGGHARECIGEAILAYEEGYDGAIQIFPFGCMPEIVSKSILPSISKDKNFPILTLVVDEMTGEGGYVTRIEAFLDLLERRKKACII